MHRPPLVYLTFDDLEPDCRPARLVREYGATLITVDIRTTRHEFMLWAVDLWTGEEQRVLRLAYGHPERGPLHRWMDSDDLCFLYVPPAVRLPGSAPLQGPVEELERRGAAGLLVHERQMLAAELVGAQTEHFRGLTPV